MEVVVKQFRHERAKDRLRRRLRCGLTRRRPLLPAPDSGKPQLCAPALAGAAAHDSS